VDPVFRTNDAPLIDESVVLKSGVELFAGADLRVAPNDAPLEGRSVG
jgi:hypothetical protein